MREDQVQFRCSADPWPHHSMLTLRVARGDLPTPGPCVLCGAPMALVGRIKLQSLEDRRVPRPGGEVTDFVKTPTGVVMHVENHRRLVERLRAAKSGLVWMLEPAHDAVPDPVDSDAPAATFEARRALTAKEVYDLGRAGMQPPLPPFGRLPDEAKARWGGDRPRACREAGPDEDGVTAPATKPGRGKAPPLGGGSRTTEASARIKRRNQVAAAARRAELRLTPVPRTR